MIFKATAVTATLFAAQLTGALADRKTLDTSLRTRKLAARRQLVNVFESDLQPFSDILTEIHPEVVTTGGVDSPVCPANTATAIDDQSCGIPLVGGSYILDDDITCDNMGIHITNGTVLDCQGKSIYGHSKLYSRGVQIMFGSVLKNCIVDGFETGLHLHGNSIVQGGLVTNSGLHGIYVGFGDNKIVDTIVDGVSGISAGDSTRRQLGTDTPSMGRGIEIYGNENNVVSGAQVSNANSVGIYITGDGNNVVSCSTMSNNGLDQSLTKDRDGLLIDGQGKNVITGSTFSSNGGSGIYLWQAGGSNSLVGCTAMANGDDGTDDFESGLVIEKSGDVFVSGGKYSDNIKDGIVAVETSGFISIEAVEALGNQRNGIYFSEAWTGFRVMGSTINYNGLLGDGATSGGTAGVKVNDSTGIISCSTIDGNKGNGVEVIGDGTATVSILDSSVSNNIEDNIHVQAGTIPVSRVSACGSGGEFDDIKNTNPDDATINLDSVTCEGGDCDYACSCPFELPSWCTSTC